MYTACPWRLPPPHVRPSMRLPAPASPHVHGQSVASPPSVGATHVGDGPEPPHVHGQSVVSPPPVGATNVGDGTHVPMSYEIVSPVSPSDDSPPPVDNPTAVLDTVTADQPRVRRTPPPPPPPPKRYRAAMVDGTTLAPKASVPCVPFNGFATCVPFTAQAPPDEATMPMPTTSMTCGTPMPQVRTQGERTHSGWRIKAAELAWVVMNGPHTKILQGRTAVEIARQYASNQHLQVNYNEVHSRCRQP